ncbi:hypothetical protein BV25DRAFT_1912053 [Artomyces pyxidatus]|uniref:Uncharacterized protein n=1 Tax=Artomyces pyxidatus TaxID=48021 RepID=A0ACB8TG64_9AGAM|nr:hypothetical protein BV25DRAFT_1912053 [Artomyces pyxidatus]
MAALHPLVSGPHRLMPYSIETIRMALTVIGLSGPAKPNIRSLPPEVVEEILILATALGFPTTVSTLAQASRSFHHLVYHQFHKHLWREMFLNLFDDPRPVRDILSYGCRYGTDTVILAAPTDLPEPKGKKKQVFRPADEFPWEDEYKRRIWTANFIRRHTDPDSQVEHRPTADELYRVVQTLLRVITTSAPLPSASLAGIPPPSHPHPVFSPLSVATHTQPKLITRSQNILWLSSVLSRGYPKELMNRLSALSEDGHVDVPKTAETYDGLLAKLIAQTGLMEPISSTHGTSKHHTLIAAPLELPEHGGALLQTELDEDDDASLYEAGSSENSDSSDSGDSSTSSDHAQEGAAAEDDPETDEDDLISEGSSEQHGIRRLARIRVYNMYYLNRQRNFGPYLPISPARTSSYPHPRTQHSTSFFADEESTTEPAIPEGNIYLSSLDDGDDPDNPLDPDFVDDGASHLHSPEHEREVPPELLRFDWAWISAARQVVELNLRDLLMGRHHNVLRALMSLEGLRPCSAPGFAEDMMRSGDYEEDTARRDTGVQCHGKVEGWDWAGVEGQWRRCVCWLDYRDLVGNNVGHLNTRFNDSALYEVMRIIPVNIRIASYSDAPAAWPGRPTINIVGEIVGHSNSELLKVRGKVEMVAGGDIRWTMYTLREDGEGEWQSDGVQLGGLGSATGVIGMWTGAGHEHMDPLGPFWAWKVGSTDVHGQSSQTVQGKALQLRTPAK